MLDSTNPVDAWNRRREIVSVVDLMIQLLDFFGEAVPLFRTVSAGSRPTSTGILDQLKADLKIKELNFVIGRLSDFDNDNIVLEVMFLYIIAMGDIITTFLLFICRCFPCFFISLRVGNQWCSIGFHGFS